MKWVPLFPKNTQTMLTFGTKLSSLIARVFTFVLVVAISVVVLAGCTINTGNEKDLEIAKLKNEISAHEKMLESQKNEISSGAIALKACKELASNALAGRAVFESGSTVHDLDKLYDSIFLATPTENNNNDPKYPREAGQTGKLEDQFSAGSVIWQGSHYVGWSDADLVYGPIFSSYQWCKKWALLKRSDAYNGYVFCSKNCHDSKEGTPVCSEVVRSWKPLPISPTFDDYQE